MDVEILCDLCGKRIASHVCRLCGRRVCDSDFDENLGICISCKRGKGYRESANAIK